MQKSNNDIFWCSNCLNISTRPRITFDERGKCNSCIWSEKKREIDWKKKENEFLKLIKKLRKKNKSEFDLIVPVSGGKDGSHVAHILKEKFKLNPLPITVHPYLRSEIGYKNLENFKKNNFDLLEINLPYETLRKLSKFCFIDHGKPGAAWQTGIFSSVIRIAIKMGINLIVYGECGETEYGGTSHQQNLQTFSQKFLKKVYLEGKHEKMMKQVKNKKDLYWWTFPRDKSLNLNLTFWSHFENWDPYIHYLTAKKHCGYEDRDQKNYGTYTNYAQNDTFFMGLHYYLMYLKFGFGRTTQDVGIDIRRGSMTRSQGKQLVESYDREYPEEDIEKCREFFQMNKVDFNKVLDKFANKKLFIKKNNRWTPSFNIK